MSKESSADKVIKEGFYRRSWLSRWIILFLCLAGFLVSLDLAWLHYKVHTDPSFHSFCAISDSFNCETVAESSYSVLLGLPIAVWGMLGYMLMGVFAAAAFFQARREAAHLTLMALAVFSVICSLTLALVSYCVICSFCLLCTISYLINLSLLGSLVATTRFRSFPWKDALKAAIRYPLQRPFILTLAVVGVAVLAALFPRYWEKGGGHRRADSLSFGVTAEGAHWIGAQHAVLTVVEYSDYLCPHCRRGHLTMRNLTLSHPGKMRLIHRHFPLDQECNRLILRPFHKGACLLSRAAYCAGQQRKFWEMNDRLVQGQTAANLRLNDLVTGFAGELGMDLQAFNECLKSEQAVNAVKDDIESGLVLGISGTPSFVVGDKVYLGVLPPEVMSQLKDGE
jgi:protein-disulfide isomerase/uncharacterized membrane protein